MGGELSGLAKMSDRDILFSMNLATKSTVYISKERARPGNRLLT